MKKFLFMSLAVCFSSSSFATVPSLQAQLVTEYISELKATIEISNGADDKTWTITTHNSCPSYPCRSSDFVKTEKVVPVVLEDRVATDGCLALKLDSKRKITYCPAWGNEHPYQLVVTETGKEKSYELFMQGFISR